ncbi:hypothetical protein D478_18431, partial [Brevibacillus agri BAB-2500]
WCGEERDEIAVASWAPCWGYHCPAPGEKAKPRPKVVDSGSLSELDAKSVFRFFPGASVGSPKSFRGFRLFPRQGLRGIGPFANLFESYECTCSQPYKNDFETRFVLDILLLELRTKITPERQKQETGESKRRSLGLLPSRRGKRKTRF